MGVRKVNRDQLDLFGARTATAVLEAEPAVVAAAVPARSVVVAEAAVPAPLVGRRPPPPASAPKSKLLHHALKAALGAHVELVINDNRTTLLSQSKKGPRHIIRVHQMFLSADASMFTDIARYLASGDKAAGLRIDRFIEVEGMHLLDHHVAELDEDAHVGQHHELRSVFDRLNGTYFGGSIRADITWGQRTRLPRGRVKRSSITLGTYDERARRITIHPVLDQRFVPPLCVARVVHHEMCHALHPAERGPGGRRLVHSPKFRAAEARFAGAEEADVWFDTHLAQLLRYRGS